MSIFAFPKGLPKATSAQWGFSNNVLPNASLFDLSIRCGGSVVSSPVEQGSFISYNKTTEPLEITATLSFSGSNSFLQSVLDNLTKVKESVTTFSIETPVIEYENMTLQNYDYAMRREDGLGVLYVSAVFVEIKEVQLAYTKTDTILQADSKDASNTSTVDGGMRQGQTPTSEQDKRGKSIARTIGDWGRGSS